MRIDPDESSSDRESDVILNYDYLRKAIDDILRSGQVLPETPVEVWVSTPLTGLPSAVAKRLAVIKAIMGRALRAARPAGYDVNVYFGGRYDPMKDPDIHPSEVSEYVSGRISCAAVSFAVMDPPAHGVFDALHKSVGLELPSVIVYAGDTTRCDIDVHRRQNPPHLRGLSRIIRDHPQERFHYLSYVPDRMVEFEDMLSAYWRGHGRMQITSGLTAHQRADQRESVAARAITRNRRIQGLTCGRLANLLKTDSRVFSVIGEYPRFLKVWHVGFYYEVVELVDCFQEFPRHARQRGLFEVHGSDDMMQVPQEVISRIAESHEVFEDFCFRNGLDFGKRESLWFSLREFDFAPVFVIKNGRSRIIQGGSQNPQRTLFPQETKYLATRMPHSYSAWMRQWEKVKHD